MKSALLRGRDHVALGAIDAVAEADAAIAISVGGAPKTYSHADPNEDAALFAIGEVGTLVAVADGHRGFEAAEVALEHLVANPAPHWTAAGGVDENSWNRQALAVLSDAHAQVQSEIERQAGAAPRTTLSLALVLPEAGVLLYASIGDSHLFRVRGDQTVDLVSRSGDARNQFLGDYRLTPTEMAERAHIGSEPLHGVRAIVLATDGLSEKGIGVANPGAAVQEAVDTAARAALDLRALESARGVAERALAAQAKQRSGDNVAAAVVWLGA
ncbi:MAG: protein phosphatase 2C domain-containing protein [Myxococcales bacterium]|nr:protein phosphatase 2C domain-containing protein [Myxococcales bacterium]